MFDKARPTLLRMPVSILQMGMMQYMQQRKSGGAAIVLSCFQRSLEPSPPSQFPAGRHRPVMRCPRIGTLTGGAASRHATARKIFTVYERKRKSTVQGFSTFSNFLERFGKRLSHAGLDRAWSLSVRGTGSRAHRICVLEAASHTNAHLEFALALSSWAGAEKCFGAGVSVQSA